MKPKCFFENVLRFLCFGCFSCRFICFTQGLRNHNLAVSVLMEFKGASAVYLSCYFNHQPSVRVSLTQQSLDDRYETKENPTPFALYCSVSRVTPLGFARSS